MANTASWLIGSFTLAANATVVVNGNNRTIDAGTYYLRDATSSLSLIAALQTEIAAVVGGSTVVIGQDRKLRIISGGGALTLTIPTSLQEVLGLPANPAVGTTVTASNVSTLLWSPGWNGTTRDHPADVSGRLVYDRVHLSSATGLTQTVVTHSSQRLAEWSWFAVRQARVWTTDDGEPGEFMRFWTDVLIPGQRFKLYREVAEDDASATAVTWPSPALGPYVMREPDFEWYQRFDSRTDSLGANLNLKAIVTAEIA